MRHEVAIHWSTQLISPIYHCQLIKPSKLVIGQFIMQRIGSNLVLLCKVIPLAAIFNANQ